MTLPSDLPARLRQAGVKVEVLPGWQARGRPGAFAPRGVLWHHTGGGGDGIAYARWMGVTGRPDLPAPLSQLSIGRDGTVYVLAAGRANHAGTAKASGPMPSGDGNALYVGVECHNTGSEGWGVAQYTAMVETARVLSDVLGCPASHHRAHKETSVTGKWDPGLLEMVDFRNDVGEAIRLASRPTLRNPRPVKKALATGRKQVNRSAKSAARARDRAERQGYPWVADQAEKLRREAVALRKRLEALRKRPVLKGKSPRR